ncbi:phospho-acceptor domain-containing protein [Mucilaginibacter oryzae]|uniref:histidine kinase n=2 Tax=Mucilaginibacter oryzae TaxID=468058 RepID=A0A316HFZ6_9SPHI|nr:phospho-acceptor domain-containing protein [Mucilaginibacter oryzae]
MASVRPGYYDDAMGKLLRGKLRTAVLLSCIFIVIACGRSNTPGSDNLPDISAIIERATVYKDQGATKKALALIDSARHTYPGAGPADRSRIYKFMANWSLGKKDYELAGLYIDSMQQVLNPFAKQTGYDLLYADSYLMKGDLLFSQGLYSYAFQYYFKSREQILEDSARKDLHFFTAHYFERLAMISYKQENFALAGSYYKKEVGEIDKTGKSDFNYIFDKQGALSNLSSSFLKSGLPDSALFYYREALQFLEQNLTKYPEKKDFFEMARGVIVGNMGDAWMMKKQYALAERSYREDIDINDRPGRYKQDALMTRLKLARLFMQTGRLSQAGLLLASAGRSPVLADTDSKINFLMTRADYSQAVGKYVDALDDLRKRSILRDSIQQYRRKLLSANMNGIFKVMEMESEKRSMEKRDQFESAAILVFSIMVFIILAMLSRMIYTSRRRVKDGETRNSELRLTLREMEVTTRERIRVSDLLAHDLRNPLHALSTIVSLMLEDNRNDEDTEMLGIAKESIMKINLIIDDILHKDKNVDQGKLDFKEIDLAALLRHSVALLRFKAAEKQQKIIKNSVRSLIVFADQHKLWRVFNNLLVNAIKFSPNNTTIWVELNESDGLAILSIRDEGIGIPDHLKERIFQNTAEARRVGTAGEETFGLGLYASKQIVEAHAGKITFDDRPEGGTTFYVCLPLGGPRSSS